MTVTKTILREDIKRTELLIQAYNEEAQKFPQIARHNEKQVLKMQGRIEAYESLIANF